MKFNFFKQHIFPGVYAAIVDKRILARYNKQLNYGVDTSAIAGKEESYIEQIKKEIDEQLDRKNNIEDKAKSLLFIITVAITTMTFSLNYLDSISNNKIRIISFCLVVLSVLYFIFGAIRALQIFNIKAFHIYQSNITTDTEQFAIQIPANNVEELKDLIKSKELNNLINIRIANYTYASFNLIRNGIILFALFFLSAICFSLLNQKPQTVATQIVKGKSTVKINDSVNIVLPYSFEVKSNINNLKVDTSIPKK